MTTPKVINLRDTGGKVPEGAVRVDRATKWGNPFRMTDGLSRAEVIRAFRDLVQTQGDLLAALPELRGKDLACWCAPLPCHADVLLELANRRDQ